MKVKKKSQKKWPQPKWAILQIFRENGVVENLCKHGVGHPNRVWLEQNPSPYADIHGCDVCCWKEEYESNQKTS